LSKCTHESRVAAWGMKGVREARVGKAGYHFSITVSCSQNTVQ
jgi:hypothetical protein